MTGKTARIGSLRQTWYAKMGVPPVWSAAT